VKATRVFFVAAAVSLVAGCATPYQSTGFRGGYSETLLAPDVFRIYFRGNAFTSIERAQDFALLRAAELARERGFAYFAIVDESSSSSVHAYTTPGQSYSSGSAVVTGNVATYSGQTTYYPGQTSFMYKPRTGLVIRCFAEKPEGIFTFEAAFLEESLRQKYGLR
jgi:hypothetical protein